MIYANDLWGSTLIEFKFDVVAHTLRMRLAMLYSGAESLHDITCTNVTKLEFFSDIPLPWTYAEVTELVIDSAPDGQVVLDVMLWSEDAGISVACGSVARDVIAAG